MESSNSQQKPISQYFKITTILDPSTFVSNPQSESQNPTKTFSKEGNEVHQVPGLFLIKDFITPAEETLLFSEGNKLNWYKFGTRYRTLLGWMHDRDDSGKMRRLGDLPDSLKFVTDRVMENKIMNNPPEQCVINSYEPGQGINAHIDRVEDYGKQVVGLSLGSDTVMEFTGPRGEKVELFVPRRSLYLMEKDARYKWKHAMPGRKKDKLENGTMNVRRKRISLTFRDVIVGFRKKDI